MKKQWFVAVFTVALILSVAFTSDAFSQTPPPDESSPRIQSLGVREIVSPIKDFCIVFQQELSERSGTQVRYISIENEYRGKLFSRFQGLLDGLIDAECGPNSISAQYLINPNSDGNSRYSEEIAFSNPFYETEIRLLLRNELAGQLANMAEDELAERLRGLSIGLLENTTTLRQFQNRSQLYANTQVFETPDEATSNLGKNSLEQALDALEGEEIEALASDGITLKSFLVEGIPGENLDAQNTIRYRKSRVPYGKSGFSIFPAEGSLLGLDGEQYGIVVLRDEDTNSFQREVNSVLSDLNEPGSRLAMARENIRAYELGLQPSPSGSSLNPANDQADSPSNSNEFSDGGRDDPNFLIILAVLGFFSLLVVLAILRFKDSFRGQISGPIGSLTIEGSNDSSRRSGINITDATSRQGSIQAIENTGRGIDARKLDAQGDITLSSDKGNQLQPSDKLIDSGREEIGVDLSDIVAGRDITVQQIFQDIGVTDSNFNAGRSADVYISLWESIFSLKLALMDFFEAPSADSLSCLALQIKETRIITHKGEFYFKDSDRSRLFAVLQDMSEVRIGRKFLRDIRSTDNVREAVNSGIIIPSSRDNLNTISAVSERLEDLKLDYESTIERLKPFFKEKLSL